MVYSCDHDTEGEVTLSMGHGKKLDHMGIQVKFFGRIDMVRPARCIFADIFIESFVHNILFYLVNSLAIDRRVGHMKGNPTMTLFHSRKNFYHRGHSLISVPSPSISEAWKRCTR